MKITIFIYDGFTVLDAIGPYEMLSCMGDAEIQFVAKTKGVVFADTRTLPVIALTSIDDVRSSDILIIPGGPGDQAVREDKHILEWVRKIHATSSWTTSVCTGSLILAAAGLLNGRQAATHWARRDVLESYGAKPIAERWVKDGKIITAAGVSAGIDMALYLISILKSPLDAQAAQLALEYDPAPPFDAGSPEKAPVEIREIMLASLEDAMRERLERTAPQITTLD